MKIQKSFVDNKKIVIWKKLILAFLIMFLYLYFIIVWTPKSYVPSLELSYISDKIKLIIIIVTSIILSLIFVLQTHNSKAKGLSEIEDYQMWNKFLLHYAFMKTGAGSEKEQVFEILMYLDDCKLKDDLTIIYTESQTLKDAHNQICEKYPYPQIKTFFSETEDALIKVKDGENLIQKTALNIDKYINDIKVYNQAKKDAFNISSSLIIIIFILMFGVKIGFSDAFINFTNSYVTLSILILFYILTLQCFVMVKKKMDETMIEFGGKN